MNLIAKGDKAYPRRLIDLLGSNAPESISALGNIAILEQPALGLFCSIKCPGSIILQTYDLMCELREAGVPVIGGFHSPMEQECLRLLLRGKQPVTICPARNIPKRIPADWKKPLEEGRLLILSPFAEKHHRITAQLAQERNLFVAALASKILIAYASPGGKTAQFARQVLEWGKPIFTLSIEHNQCLIDLGAFPTGLNLLTIDPATNLKTLGSLGR